MQKSMSSSATSLLVEAAGGEEHRLGHAEAVAAACRRRRADRRCARARSRWRRSARYCRTQPEFSRSSSTRQPTKGCVSSAPPMAASQPARRHVVGVAEERPPAPAPPPWRGSWRRTCRAWPPASISRQSGRPAAGRSKIAREPSVEPLSAKRTSQGWSHSWAATPSRVSRERALLVVAGDDDADLQRGTPAHSASGTLPNPAGAAGSTRGARRGYGVTRGGARPTHCRPPSLSWRAASSRVSRGPMSSPPQSTAVPPAAPVRRSFRQKLVRKSWSGARRRAAPRRSAGARGDAGGDRPARHGAPAPAGRGGAGARARRWSTRRSGSGPARPSSPRRRRSSTARARGWAAAAPLFAAPAARRAPGAAAALLRGRPAPAAGARAARRRERPADLDPETAAALVVYTTAFGAEPDPAPVFAGIRRPALRLPHRPAARRGRLGGAAAAARARPTGPGRAPPPGAASAPISRWPRRRPGPRPRSTSRSDRWLVGNLHTLLLRWCLPHDLALWRHPTGIDWQDLAEARLITGAPAAGAVIAQAEGLRGARRCRATAAPGTPA